MTHAAQPNRGSARAFPELASLNALPGRTQRCGRMDAAITARPRGCQRAGRCRNEQRAVCPACLALCRGPIKWRSALRNTIYDVLQSKKDWVETESETDWDFFWADKG